LLSLLIHVALALLILAAVPGNVASPPLEIALIEGSAGTAAGVPGGERAGVGPLAPPRSEGNPVEAPPAPAAQYAFSRRSAKPKPVARPAVGKERLATSPETNATPMTPAFASALPNVTQQREPTRGDVSTRPTGGGGTAVSAGGGGDGTRGHGFSVSGGARSYASIWQGTQRYLAKLRWAYNNELRTNAALRGVIVVRYEIHADGAVGDVAMVSSELRAPRLEQQVLSQIRDWRYPPEPTGTVIVTWPFSFLPPR
jgi:TonB family protein